MGDFILIPEASLKVPDFTFSVYSSSCSYIFFGLILAHFLFFLFTGIPKAECTEIVKSGTTHLMYCKWGPCQENNIKKIFVAQWLTNHNMTEKIMKLKSGL